MVRGGLSEKFIFKLGWESEKGLSEQAPTRCEKEGSVTGAWRAKSMGHPGSLEMKSKVWVFRAL